MTDEQKSQDNTEDPIGDCGSGSLKFNPRRKYERIMLAAAEATRLNEEIRRKGTKLGAKVTVEALKRVDEGKVAIELRGASPAPADEEIPADPIPEIPSSTLFAPPAEDTIVDDEETDEITPPELD